MPDPWWRAHKRSLIYGLGVIVLIAASVAIQRYQSQGSGVPAPAGSVHVSGAPRSELLAPGTPIPGFSAPALGGGEISWSDYAGSPVVLAIWASWCPHCQAELPRLDAVVDQFPAVRMLTITTAIGERRGPSPAGFMKDQGLDFPVARDDAKHTLLEAFGVQVFPTFYLVSSDSTVVRSIEGETDEGTLRTLIGGLR